MEKETIERLRKYDTYLDSEIKRERIKLERAGSWECVDDARLIVYEEIKRKLYEFFPDLQEKKKPAENRKGA